MAVPRTPALLRSARCGPRLAAATVLLSAVLVLVLPVPVPASATEPSGAGWAGPSTGQEGGTDPVGTWPLVPRPEVVATFDPPADPWGPGHRGVDLAGRIGQAVRSALPGEVVFAGRIGGKPVAVVSHGDTRTTYEPVVATVAVGTRVDAGAVIGVLDLPGSHCFPRACLHWGWLHGEVYLDPLDLVGGGPVRLLPLWRDAPVTPAGWRPPVHPYATWSPPPVPRAPVLPPVTSSRPQPQPAPPAGGRAAGWLP